MKTTTNLLLTVTFLLCSYVSQAQSFKTAVDYLNFVGEEQTEVSKSMWKYTKAVAHSKRDKKIRKRRQQLLKQIATSKKIITKASGFDGRAFKDEVLKLISINESLLKQDYAKIVDMKEVAEQSYDFMEAYIVAQQLADKKMEEAQAEYEANFITFAGKHNINIIENESDLSKKMAKSNLVFGYNNDLYLVFFKVYINDVYLTEAMNTKDISGIQQNANALNTASKEGLEILKTYEAFGTDKSTIAATKKVFDYYVSITENEINKIVDFYVVNEDFETIKKSIDATPESKRTQAQLDAYNAKVKGINKAANAYNKTNQSLNTKKQNVFNTYEAAKTSFLDRHIPND